MPGMFVLSREPGASIYVGSAQETCVITVVGIEQEPPGASVLVNRSRSRATGAADVRTVRLRPNSAVQIGAATLKLIDLFPTRARFMIEGPTGINIHRLEVYEAMRDLGAA